MLEKLQRELESVMPEPNSQPRWNELEQLPYLVRHSLRFVYIIRRSSEQVHDLTPF